MFLSIYFLGVSVVRLCGKIGGREVEKKGGKEEGDESVLILRSALQ